MAALDCGLRSTRKGRGGRPVLGLTKAEQPPVNSSKLAGGEREEHSGNLSEVQRFEAALWDARNRWDIARRTNGLPHGQLSRAGAEKAFNRLCGTGNALAQYRRDGGK